MNTTYCPLLGTWAILPEWLTAHRGTLQAFMDGAHVPHKADIVPEAKTFEARDLVQRQGTLAVIPVHGPMIKRAGFWEMLFGYTGTDTIRAALGHAMADEEVQGILLHVESPGGHTAGVHELSEAVRLAASIKPVAVHMEDLGASAAYWASAHATRITASPTTEVGSLGTMAIVADMSQMTAQAGITVHVVSTGAMKGLGVMGTPITEAHLAEIQRRVTGVNQFFMRAVQRGRHLTAEQLTAVTDGRVFLAAEAKTLGLIDEVRSTEAALRDLGRVVTQGRARETQERLQQRRAALTELKEAAQCPPWLTPKERD